MNHKVIAQFSDKRIEAAYDMVYHKILHSDPSYSKVDAENISLNLLQESLDKVKKLVRG